MRYKVTLSYNGTAYSGFQSQKNAASIQDTVETALGIIFRSPIRIVGASRTDQGVHAYGQVFHFDAEERDTYKLKGSLNALLPKDIHVIKVERVDGSFHARYSVHEKTYVYLINIGERDVFLENRAFQKNYILDVEKMKEVAALFQGKHDFTSFNTSPLDQYPNQVRNLRVCQIRHSGKRMAITFTGDGFLRHMVRIMVGAMVDVGRGNKDIKEIETLLQNPTKSKRRYNIDACGLYLVKIDYK